MGGTKSSGTLTDESRMSVEEDVHPSGHHSVGRDIGRIADRIVDRNWGHTVHGFPPLQRGGNLSVNLDIQHDCSNPQYCAALVANSVVRNTVDRRRKLAKNLATPACCCKSQAPIVAADTRTVPELEQVVVEDVRIEVEREWAVLEDARTV